MYSDMHTLCVEMMMKKIESGVSFEGIPVMYTFTHSLIHTDDVQLRGYNDLL